KEYSIDKSRIYVTGLSLGGFGTWDIISRHPELFAAAIPVCGGGDPSYAEVLVDMPIWTFHGSADSIVPVEGTREMVEALKAAGSELIKYTEYENAEHNVWNMAYVEDDLLTWLFGSTKKSIVYDVMVTEGEGGSVTCPATVNYGESLTINVTPASGYELEKLLVNGEAVTLTENSYTLQVVYKDVKIEAAFKAAEIVEPGKNETDADTDSNYNTFIYIIAAAAAIAAGGIVAVIFTRRKKSKG
ncbi:MAG: prolyl oligopeptidase family serine peptidase, partial [Eubacteriales bacterium]|nr:prolyl oligopeptidase family serine peptidase [Eubacteriales bacterium]